MARGFRRSVTAALSAAVLAASALAGPALAQSSQSDSISYKTAIFSGLDKITGRVSKFDATVGEHTRFGVLDILVRACEKKPPEDPPQTAAYVEIRQIDEQTGNTEEQPIFRGWMFAESPGLNALEHPVYDVWVDDCKAKIGDTPSKGQQ